MSAAPAPEMPRTALWKKLAWALVASVLALWLCIELLSHYADGVVARRAADPSFDARAHVPDLWDRWSSAALDPVAAALANARVVPHPFLGYALKPGWSTPAGARAQASHNSLGLRGKEVSRAKPAGVFRIVTLGGSSVYGSQDSCDDSVWSARLERILNEARPGARCEVLNGGCLGYNSFEMLASFEFRLLDLQPDLVLTYEAINDMKAALYTRGGIAVQSDNTHYRNAWVSERPAALDGLLDWSRAWRIWRRYHTEAGERSVDLYAYIQRNYGNPQEGHWYCVDGQDWPAGAVPEQGLVNYRRNLNSLISLADAAGVRVVLATQALVRRHMEREECKGTQLATFDRIQEIEREVARERGMALCDCGPLVVAEVERVFASAHAHEGLPTPLPAEHAHCRQTPDGQWHRDLFHNDVHPYDEGSELIARTIAAWLLAPEQARLLQPR